jgi:ABC-2 type transport system ATP-binding protein
MEYHSSYSDGSNRKRLFPMAQSNLQPAILSVDKLTKQYGTFRALDECDLKVYENSIFGLLGPNGSGKTTLIRCLLGYLQPTSGRASVQELDCRTQSLLVRQRVGYLPAEPKLFRMMRGRDCIDFFTSMHPRGSKTAAMRYADRLALDLSRRVAFMSTGMRRKLSICCVLGCPSPLMILDEPTENLDPSVRFTVIDLIQEIHQQGSTVVLCSHILSEIESLCDQVGVLRQGKIVRTARLDEVRTTHLLRAEMGPEGGPGGGLSDLPGGIRILETKNQSVTLELAGTIDAYCNWISQSGLRNIRLELVGLRGLYDQYHHPDGIPSKETRRSMEHQSTDEVL